MPTAAKLFAAVAMAVVAFFAAEMIKPGRPEQTVWGNFTAICALFGVLVGWLDLGRLVGKGYGPAITTGIRSAAVLVFWCMTVFSIREMLIRSTSNRYKGVAEALEGTFIIVSEYAQALLRFEPLVVLGVGGILAAFFAEWASKRWP